MVFVWALRAFLFVPHGALAAVALDVDLTVLASALAVALAVALLSLLFKVFLISLSLVLLGLCLFAKNDAINSADAGHRLCNPCVCGGPTVQRVPVEVEARRMASHAVRALDAVALVGLKERAYPLDPS